MSAAGARRQILTFALAGDELGVELGGVREVVACGPITRVPSTPPFMRGVTSLRGRALPVIDLAQKLGFGETAITRWTCLLLVRVDIDGEPTELGALVDEVRQLLDREAAEIEPPPPLGTRIHPDYVTGLVRADGAIILVLDLHRVLSTEELRLVASTRDAPPLADQTPPHRLDGDP